MALYKYHYIELDTKRSPRISLQNIVAGETGNRLWITVTNNGETVDMSEKDNDEFIYRVCLKIDSDLGTRRQDSSQENSGITFIEAATGDHGKINILLSKDSFTAGMNRCRIEIFSKRAADNDTLICSAEWTFRAAGNPTGENAGNVYPSLIALENELNQLIDEAEDAIEDCEDATAAANDATDAANAAAETLNNMLENIDDEPTQNSNNLVKSGGVYSFVNDKVQEAADDVRAQIPAGATANPLMDGTAAKGSSQKWAREDHVHPHDTSKQDVLTFDNAPTTNSNNPVKSGGIKTAIDAAEASASKKNVYIVKHDSSTWVNNVYQTYTDDSGEELLEIAENALFAAVVPLPTGEIVTCYETHRSSTNVYLQSETVNGKFVTADFSFETALQSHLEFHLHDDESPLLLHPTNATYDTSNNEIDSVTFEETAAQIISAYGRPMSFYLTPPLPADAGQGAVANDYLVTLVSKKYYSNTYELQFIVNIPHTMGISVTVNISNNSVSASGNYSYSGLQ